MGSPSLALSTTNEFLAGADELPRRERLHPSAATLGCVMHHIVMTAFAHLQHAAHLSFRLIVKWAALVGVMLV